MDFDDLVIDFIDGDSIIAIVAHSPISYKANPNAKKAKNANKAKTVEKAQQDPKTQSQTQVSSTSSKDNTIDDDILDFEDISR